MKKQLLFLSLLLVFSLMQCESCYEKPPTEPLGPYPPRSEWKVCGNDLNPDKKRELIRNENQSKEESNVDGLYYCEQIVIQFGPHQSPKAKEALREEWIALGAMKIDSCNCNDDIELWGTLKGVDLLHHGDKANQRDTLKEFGRNFIIDIPEPVIQEESYQIDGDTVPKQSSDKGNIKVAIVDSGIDNNHPYLTPYLWENEVSAACDMTDFGYDFYHKTDGTVDNDGHGTHIAGIISKDFPNGYFLEIIDAKFADKKVGDLFDAICGIHYAIDNGAKVINLSWGYEGQKSSLLESALERAKKEDVVVVVAAGNNVVGKDNDEISYWPANIQSSTKITVAALDGSENKLADFSHYGSTNVNIAAKGTNIRSTFPNSQEGEMSGSSMSAAFVTRTAVEIRMRHPNMKADKVVECILDKAKPNLSGSNLVVGNRINNNVAAISLCGN